MCTPQYNKESSSFPSFYLENIQYKCNVCVHMRFIKFRMWACIMCDSVSDKYMQASWGIYMYFENYVINLMLALQHIIMHLMLTFLQLLIKVYCSSASYLVCMYLTE